MNLLGAVSQINLRVTVADKTIREFHLIILSEEVIILIPPTVACVRRLTEELVYIGATAHFPRTD